MTRAISIGWPDLIGKCRAINFLRYTHLSLTGHFGIMHGKHSWGAFVWDQSGIRIIGIMQVSVCLGAILIPEYLDSILAIVLPGAE